MTNDYSTHIFLVAGLDFMDNSGVRVDYENALINAGFGKFHYLLLTICGLIYLNTAIGITIISFVLPSATCDFQMSSKDKGLLTAAPMLGMWTYLFLMFNVFNLIICGTIKKLYVLRNEILYYIIEYLSYDL